MAIECVLECGHEVEWHDDQAPPVGDPPWVGRLVWCEECFTGVEVESCWPDKIYVDDFLLSESEPSQTPCSPSGMAYTSGTRCAVFYSLQYGEWGWHVYGVSADGWAFEGEDLVGFDDADTAKEDALASWQEYKEYEE